MRILIIEDERQLSDVLAVLLKQNMHESDAVYNGVDGEDYALNSAYDAIILDIMLPGKSGLEVLRSIRRQGNSTPVLLLTAKAGVEDRINGLDAGADDYLTKPFSAGELMARLRAITRRGSEYIGDELHAGNTTLNKNTHDLAGGKGSVKLAVKEYQIMEILLSNNRQIIPRERFVEKMWGFNSEAEYNNVEVYVSFVRKKLAVIGSNLQIKAVRNVGYELEVAE